MFHCKPFCAQTLNHFFLLPYHPSYNLGDMKSMIVFQIVMFSRQQMSLKRKSKEKRSVANVVTTLGWYKEKSRWSRVKSRKIGPILYKVCKCQNQIVKWFNCKIWYCELFKFGALHFKCQWSCLHDLLYFVP